MIAFVDAAGLPVLSEGGRWALEEARRYEVRGARAPFDRVRWDDQPLPALGGGAFLLDVGHRVGRIFLDWHSGDTTGRATIDIEPRAEKLPPELWLTLVEELEAWLPSVTVGLDGARHGGVGTEGVGAGWFAEALLPLVPLLVRATEALLANLRVRVATRLEDQPLRLARQVPRETLTWIGRHPDVAQWLDGWSAAELTGSPPAVPLRRTVDTLDHPANRYVHWLLRRVVARLAEAADRLDRIGGDEELVAWCKARAGRLRAASERLRTLVRRSPLHAVPPAPATEAALGVVLDDPRYARVHALARRFVSPRFSLTETDTPASVRPSYGVYELWCFLAVERALVGSPGDPDTGGPPGFVWSRTGTGRLLDPQGTGGGACLVGRSATGVLEVGFNRTFASYRARGDLPRWSLSGERRPDLVVSWIPHDRPGDAAWIVLDAKYRVGANLVDAFTSVHLYRDALRWNGLGGRARAGVLLTPSRTADTAAYFADTFRAEHGMGAFELRPDADHTALRDWIVGTLGAR